MKIVVMKIKRISLRERRMKIRTKIIKSGKKTKTGRKTGKCKRKLKKSGTK